MFRIIAIICCAILLTTVLFACTVKMPVSLELQIQDPPQKKIPKKLLVVMSREQSEAVFIYKKGAFADIFVFDAGRSIQVNLMRAMGSMFQELQFANDIPAVKDRFDLYLRAEFKGAEVHAGSLFGQSKVNIFADYSLLDKNGADLKKIETRGNIQRGYSGSTKGMAVGVVLAPVAGAASGMQGRRDIANMWDDAVALSLTQLMQELRAIVGP